MIEFVVDKGKNCKDLKNRYSYIGDWLTLEEQAGFRKLEYTQIVPILANK